jgi:hypothetical protein
MASPISAIEAIPRDFTTLDRSFITKTEAALKDGLELEQWSRDPNRKITTFPLDLDRVYHVPNKPFGYFCDVTIGGRKLTALGVLQEVEFGKLPGKHPEERLKDYVLNHFMNSSHWTHANGALGGFTFRQMIYKTMDGRYGRYADDELTEARPYSLIGTKYAWSLLTIYLHDFIVNFGPLTHTFKEAVAVVQHPDFVHVIQNPRPGFKLEVAFGYPFIDYAPIPNYFGFGPGKFNWAIKTFSFLMRDNNDVVCNMDFIAGARPKKVLDFGKSIPDPIYGTASALQMMSLGLIKAENIHNAMDGVMCAQHARVHQALMEGSAKVFAAWVKNGGN